MNSKDLLALLDEAAVAVKKALETFDRWSDGGERPDQYALDQVADSAVLEVLTLSGLSVLSEESGLVQGDTSELVIVDPVDGSTNASRRIPHYLSLIHI